MCVYFDANFLSNSKKQERKSNIILIMAGDYGFMNSQTYAQHNFGTNKDEIFYETKYQL